jgi:hypothetical protein
MHSVGGISYQGEVCAVAAWQDTLPQMDASRELL